MRYFILIYLLGASSLIIARPAVIEDMNAKGTIKRHLNIAKDYSYDEEVTICNELLDMSDQARSLGTLQFSLSGTQTLKELHAWTEIDGTKIPVSKDHIHAGKGGAKTHQGFDDRMIYTLSFSQVQIGARLCSFKKIAHRPNFPGYFEFVERHPWYLSKDSELVITSAVPLEVNIPFSNGSLTVNKSTVQGKDIYRITPVGDVIQGAFFEPSSTGGFASPLLLIVRSTSDYQSAPIQSFRDEIEQRLSQPLPEEYVAFANSLTSQLLDESEIVTRVMQFVQEKIRYMGDWRTREGKLLPRNMSLIYQTHFGDCKDFSLLTIAILREAGVKAHMAFIHRGDVHDPYAGFNFNNMFTGVFNHAVVYVKLANEQGIIVDPTTNVSYFGTLEDLLDREAFVFGEELFRFKTPTWAESEGVSELNIEREVDEHIFHSSYSLEIKGLHAADALSSYFRRSKLDIQGMIRRSFFSGSDQLYDWQLPDTNERIVKPIAWRVKAKGTHNSLSTPLGLVRWLYDPFSSLYYLAKDRVTNVYFPPKREKHHILYKNAKPMHELESLNGSLDCRWFKMERKLIAEGDSISEDYAFETKVTVISADELRSPEFADAMEQYRKLFMNKAIILRSAKTSEKDLPETSSELPGDRGAS